MTNSSVQLVETVVYRAEGRTRTSRRIVQERSRGRIGPGDNDIWDRDHIPVPPLPPTNLGGNQRTEKQVIEDVIGNITIRGNVLQSKTIDLDLQTGVFQHS